MGRGQRGRGSAGTTRPLAVGWTCTSCSQWVKDRDPAGGTHPEDLEQGHAENCARFADQVIAWQERRDS
jgi:hypothetical protein